MSHISGQWCGSDGTINEEIQREDPEKFSYISLEYSDELIADQLEHDMDLINEAVTDQNESLERNQTRWTKLEFNRLLKMNRQDRVKYFE